MPQVRQKPRRAVGSEGHALAQEQIRIVTIRTPRFSRENELSSNMAVGCGKISFSVIAEWATPLGITESGKTLNASVNQFGHVSASSGFPWKRKNALLGGWSISKGTPSKKARAMDIF